MKLSVIIVNYNVRYFLEQALLSVMEAIKECPAEVFVVDNHSADDSVQMVRERFPDVQLIANSDNPGFSIANNQAIRVSSGRYVLLLNPDTLVPADCFQKCVDFMDEHPDAGALGVKMLDGSGRFLPESKRGLPTPATAFFKTFGLSTIFPRSAYFNQYHLGHLSSSENHSVPVLAGAFMLLRRSVLDQIGLLDETFFMYGEDIDLSYRVTKAGYKNYYFSDTAILHYKGESTKKGSLNYVRVFYQAMIIFARKHFQGERATFFIFLLQIAIYFRALLTIISNFFKKLALPLLDALLIFVGLFWLKDFWATTWFDNPDYYPTSFLYVNIPLYIGVWLGSVYFRGGYESAGRVRELVKGVVTGSVLLAVIYGFLPSDYRTSRMLLLLGAVWTLVSTWTLRSLIHFFYYKNFRVGRIPIRNLVIIGSEKESNRVRDLLKKAAIPHNYIGRISPEKEDTFSKNPPIDTLQNSKKTVQLYEINEIIFCLKDVPAKMVIEWMEELGTSIAYRTVPADTDTIIGSDSKNAPGQLYRQTIRYNIADPVQQRSKRLLDILLSLLLIVFSPLFLLFLRKRLLFIKNIGQVILGSKSWVGYYPAASASDELPDLRPGILTPLEGFNPDLLDLPTIKRLNFFYARDYDWSRDLELWWRGLGNLDKKLEPNHQKKRI